MRTMKCTICAGSGKSHAGGHCQSCCGRGWIDSAQARVNADHWESLAKNSHNPRNRDSNYERADYWRSVEARLSGDFEIESRSVSDVVAEAKERGVHFIVSAEGIREAE